LKLHKVEEIICIDHDKCGAYKLFYPDMKPEEEKDYHVKNLWKMREEMKALYPDMKFRGCFMHINGSCEYIVKY